MSNEKKNVSYWRFSWWLLVHSPLQEWSADVQFPGFGTEYKSVRRRISSVIPYPGRDRHSIATGPSGRALTFMKYILVDNNNLTHSLI